MYKVRQVTTCPHLQPEHPLLSSLKETRFGNIPPPDVLVLPPSGDETTDKITNTPPMIFSPSSLQRFLRLLSLMTAFYKKDRVIDVRSSDVARALSIVNSNATISLKNY